MSSGAAAACIAATALGVAALLVAEWRGPRALAFAAKPLASSGFVALALVLGAADHAPGRLVLAALVLCWIGDVLLIPKGARAAFAAGLGSFLLGHGVYALAFATGPFSAGAAAAGAVAVAPAAVGALRWLGPHVPARLAGPVRAYVAVISLMVIAAAGAAAARGSAALAAGALAFFVSDLAVARERFVSPGPWNKVWGLPLYYGGQLLLASTAAASAPR